MARSGEHQGLQIAVIIFVILTITLSITTFMFFKESEEATKKSQEDVRKASEATKQFNDVVTELRTIKGFLGVDASDTLEKVSVSYNEDMDKFAGVLPLSARNYRVSLATLLENFLKADEERKAERVELTAMKARLDQIETEFKGLLAAQTTEATSSAQRLIEAQNEFKKQDDAHVTAREGLAAEKKASDEKFEVAKTEHEAQVKKYLTQIASLDKVNDDQSKRLLALQNTTFEVADGEIRWINQTTGTVWINLGRADSLPKQLTFSVWGHDENDVARRDIKGKIEVINILGEHLAEARILQDSISDPIVPGDKIYTPLWHPGRAERFALAGDLDINGDGISDMGMIKDLITLRGSIIDAEVTEDGKIAGPGMTLETRYLIVGAAPKSNPDKGFTEIQKQADELGVQIITLEKFLDHMGWKDPSRVVEFGREVDARDFPPVTSDKTKGRRAQGTATSGVFKKRNPRDLQNQKKESAYP